MSRYLSHALLTLVLLAWTSVVFVAQADEPTGFQAAVALEEAMVRSIAQAEQSVVAIARVRRTNEDRLDLSANPFNQLGRSAPRPGDPEFIPNDFATGVVVGREGLILTAHHVLRDDSDYWVTTPDRKTYKVNRIVGADPRSDLAVLSIDARDLSPIKFGDASKLKKGMIVIALGNPYAIARDGQASASWGIVSNLSRKDGPSSGALDQPTRPTMHQYGTLIQTDAKLNLGTSGGALLNLHGEMVGLTLSLAAALGYEQAAGFALPVDDTFLRAVDTLKQGGEVEYGFLGIQLPPGYEADARFKVGAIVRHVIEGSPAARFGLKQGDVITHVDGERIFDADGLLLNVGKLPPESGVTLRVERDDNVKTVVIGELSKNWVSGKKVITRLPPSWRGIRVDYVTASERYREWSTQHLVDPQGSVVITEVAENSPAWREGLRPEMCISHVGGQRVSTPKQFREVVSRQDGPVKVRLTVPAGDALQCTIPPEAG
jgi:S1-C subfamily serine protease